MSPGEPLGGPFGPFATGLVGLEPGLAGPDATAALFRKLLDDDFLPDPLTHEALLALAGRPVGPGSLLAEEAASAEELRLVADIEEFAAGFFAIPVAERVERWRALAQASTKHPRMIERLKALRPGLSVDRGAFHDPSPAVRRLADDVLDLFPMRPEPRAVESRDRADRYRSDESLTDSDRERALKGLARRHPAIASLSPDHLARLSKPRRLSPARRVRAKLADIRLRKSEPNRWQYVGITLFLLSLAGRLLNNAPSTPKPSPISPLAVPSGFASPANRPGPIPPARPQPIHRAIRAELKGKLREEVAKAGKSLDEPTLDRLVDGLPVEQLPGVGGMATLVLIGAWTENVHARFVARLKDGLKSTDLALNDEELDDLSRKCLPTPSSKPVRRPTPVTNPIRPETAAIARQIRDDLKGPIRREMMNIGKSITETDLERVVVMLPVEQLPQVGGMSSVVRLGYWTEPTRSRFVARLKYALRQAGLGLGAEELDEVAPRCFPPPTSNPRGSP